MTTDQCLWLPATCYLLSIHNWLIPSAGAAAGGVCCGAVQPERAQLPAGDDGVQGGRETSRGPEGYPHTAKVCVPVWSSLALNVAHDTAVIDMSVSISDCVEIFLGAPG